MTHTPAAPNDGRFDVLRAMRTFAAACFALLAIVTSPGAFAQRAADTIVTNGKILTVDAAFRTVEALAISEGRIVATGTSADIARYAGTNTRVIDVSGATVIPGLIDNHFHFTRGVETWAHRNDERVSPRRGPVVARRLVYRSGRYATSRPRQTAARLDPVEVLNEG